MSIKVFVSHSTFAKEGLEPRLLEMVPEHANFRERVCERLRREDCFEVFSDRDLPTASHWREVLFGQLGDCNAAVILINEQALLHSPWVDTEARILCWRSWVERKDHFRLIMIPFGGVTRSQISKHKPWEAIAPGEIQMETDLDIGDAQAVEKILQNVVESIHSLPYAGSQQSGSSWIVNRLFKLLDLDLTMLREICAKLDIAVASGSSKNALQRCAAQRLYERGPLALRALLDLVADELGERKINSLLHLLMTYWVDPCASSSILKFCDRAATVRTFAINGALFYFTPEAYVQQICGCTPTWPVIKIGDKGTVNELVEQVRSQLVDEFRDVLEMRLPNFEFATDEEKDDALNELLGDRLDVDRAPVFVSLSPIAARDHNLRIAIKDKYSRLGLVLCSGRSGGSDPFPGVEMLSPEIDLKVESEAWKAYSVMLSQTSQL